MQVGKTTIQIKDDIMIVKYGNKTCYHLIGWCHVCGMYALSPSEDSPEKLEKYRRNFIALHNHFRHTRRI